VTASSMTSSYPYTGASEQDEPVREARLQDRG
jgi:hypothetical protein